MAILSNPTQQRARKSMIWVSRLEASVEADPRNKRAVGIMLLTLLPFVMVTLTEMFDSNGDTN